MSARRHKPKGGQLSFLPEPPFAPSWPHYGTQASDLLHEFLQGYKRTHPEFEAKTLSWRLAAVVCQLRDLGWPIETEDISAPTPDCPDRIIARYFLPPEVWAAVLLMRKPHA